MLGNVMTVTAAPAKSQAAPVPTHTLPAPAGATGNDALPNGQKLPAPEAAAPVVDVAKAIERLNELASNSQRNLRFSVDEATGRTVITVIDAKTDEVVRQIPQSERLALAQSMKELRGSIDEFI